ncbi:MAG: FAD-dependent oxidoreductase, partial [Clostridiales bacterium]|nr:FAD-dependent oxidoreductase [Clostridiales bacterium]
MPQKIILRSKRDGVLTETVYDKVLGHVYDVIVAGLGTAGSICAVCAAQDGLDTLGLDRLPGPGGLGVYGCIWGYYFGLPHGRFERIDAFARSLYERGYALSEPRGGDGETVYHLDGGKGHSLGKNRYIHGAVKEYAIEQAARDAGCEFKFQATVCGCFTEGGAVCGVRYIKDGAFYDAFGKVVVDAAGDAYISGLAGSPLEYGRRADGAMMRYSKPFAVLSEGLVKPVWYSTDKTEKTRGTEEITSELLRLTARFADRDGTGGWTDETRIVYESSVPGIRECGHIKPVSRLTFEEYADGAETDEPLFYVFAPLDNVNPDIGFETRAHQDWDFICDMRDFGFTLGVPKETLFPAREDGAPIAGLITIGRGAGFDHDVSTGFRMKKDFQKMGEAAAVLAGNAVRTGQFPHEARYADIKGALLSEGCLNKKNRIGLARLWEAGAGGERGDKTARLPADGREVAALLESDAPGLAYWAIRVSRGRLFTGDVRARAEAAGRWRAHYAVAAALAGDAAARALSELLCEALRERGAGGFNP